MKKNLLSITFLSLSILTLLTSCSKEDTSLDTIEGSWDISSYRLNEQELIGFAYEDLSFDFGTYQNSKGEIIIHTTAMGSVPDSDTGIYIMEDHDGIVSIRTNEASIKFNYAIDGANLTLFGIDADGLRYSMVARR